MQKNLLVLLMLCLVLASCGAGKKEREGDINEKKAKLAELKQQQQGISTKIAKLEEEIALKDPSASAAKAKLVTIVPIQTEAFTHFVDLQGRVDATNISYVAPPNGQGGVVKELYVKQGDNVRKGQVLARLDATMINQQIEPLRVQLAMAEDVYKRTQNLWNNGIGTYQQVLSAKTQVETLQKQIGIIKKQASLMTVTAPTSGIADQVNVRVGETFVGATAMGPQIRIVNTGSLKVVTEVPENYLGKIGKGSKLKVEFPNLNRTMYATVNVVGNMIDPSRRTFYVEAPLPPHSDFKPNQVAIVRVEDYARPSAITIPVNTLQNDDKGKFVMVAVDEKGKLVARKRYVEVGELYGDKLEVKTGLAPGEKLVVDGFQNLYEGQLLVTA